MTLAGPAGPSAGAGGGTYHEQLQQQHQQKQQALGRWLLAGCTVVGEVSCRDIGRGVSADAGPACCKAGGQGAGERAAGDHPPPRASTRRETRDPSTVTCCDLVPAPGWSPPHLRPSLIHGARGWVVLRGLFCCSPLPPARGPAVPARPPGYCPCRLLDGACGEGGERHRVTFTEGPPGVERLRGAAPRRGKPFARRQAGGHGRQTEKGARKGSEKGRRRKNTAADALPAPRLARDPLPRFGLGRTRGSVLGTPGRAPCCGPDPPACLGPGWGSRSRSLASREWKETRRWGEFSPLPALNQNSPHARRWHRCCRTVPLCPHACLSLPVPACTSSLALGRDAPGQERCWARSLLCQKGGRGAVGSGQGGTPDASAQASLSRAAPGVITVGLSPRNGDGAGVWVPSGDGAVPRVSPPEPMASPVSSLLAWALVNPPAGSHRSRSNEKGESLCFAPNCPYL